MLSIEELELLGYNEEIRKLYIDEGLFVMSDGCIKITNQETLIEVLLASIDVNSEYINKLLPYIEDEVDHLYFEMVYHILNGSVSMRHIIDLMDIDKKGKYALETNLYYAIMSGGECNSITSLFAPENHIYAEKLGKYINLQAYAVALDFANEIGSLENNPVTLLVKKLLSAKEDNIQYILGPNTYPSNVTISHLHEMERHALMTLETGDIIDYLDEMEVLEMIYDEDESMYILIINTLVAALLIFEAEDTYVSSRSFVTYIGSFPFVLSELLRVDDYYRVDELIKEEKREQKHFNIFIEMLDIISSNLMNYNKENMKRVKKEVRSMNTGEIPLGDLLGEYQLSSIQRDVFKENEENEFISKDDKNNYYQMYREYFEKQDFREALKALIKLDKRGQTTGYDFDFNYLIQELKIYIANELEDEKGTKKALEEQKKGEEFFLKNDYINALLRFEKSVSMMRYRVPRVIARIAACYYYLRDYEKTQTILKSVPLDSLYPEDLMMDIECLYHLGRYEEMIPAFECIEEVFPDYSIRLYYMMSIAYIKLGQYKDARKMLDIASELNKDYNQVEVGYENERQIIDECESHKSTESYTMDDFIDFAMSEDEIDISDSLDEYRFEYEDDYIEALLIHVKNSEGSAKDKISYLLSVIKIIKIQDEKVNINRVYAYIDELLHDPLLSKSDQQQFTLAMKNYKKI